MVPASSPLDMVISVFVVAVFLLRISTFFDAAPPLIWVSMAMLGYGTGVATGGVLQTSGKAWHMPPPLVDAGNFMTRLLTQMDFATVDMHVLASAFHNPLGVE